MQIEFQEKVPIAYVSHELFNDWDLYFANGSGLSDFLTDDEITLFTDFNKTFIHVSEITPQILPEISNFVKTEEWKILNKKAIEVLKALNALPK